MFIIGIDPGLGCTGWGIIKYENSDIEYVDSGTIKSSPKESLSTRIRYIFEKIRIIIYKYNPHVAVIEDMFLNTNPKTTIKLGIVKGIILLALNMSEIRNVNTYASTTIKKLVTGNAKADKEDVRFVICKMLNLNENFCDKFDESDALATAIAHVRGN